MDFEYFYNREAKRFNFLKVPEILVDREEFRGLSAEAIIFIPYFLNRQECHLRITEWTRKAEYLSILLSKKLLEKKKYLKANCHKNIRWAWCKKEIGLIERVRLGLGKPNIIYVKDFMSIFQVKENDCRSQNLASEVKILTSEVKKKMNFKRLRTLTLTI